MGAAIILLGNSDSTPPSSTPEPDYGVSDVVVSTVAGNTGSWMLSFSAEWQGEGSPERRGCAYQIYDVSGSLLLNDTMTLYVGTQREESISKQVAAPPVTGAPYNATIRCAIGS